MVFFHNDGNTRIYNLTVVRHRLNEKSANAAGVSWHGAWQATNNPLQSAHPSGVVVAMIDGSVRFLLDMLDIDVLYRLADIDDGQHVSLP